MYMYGPGDEDDHSYLWHCPKCGGTEIGGDLQPDDWVCEKCATTSNAARDA
jgi:rubredoxin